MSGKHAETINEVRAPHSGACQNLGKPLQLLTSSLVDSKFLDFGFHQSD